MSKVYLVTHGWYSDYSVVAVFGTHVAANQFITYLHEQFPEDTECWDDELYGYRVEEFSLNPTVLEPLPTRQMFRVSMRRNGDDASVHLSEVPSITEIEGALLGAVEETAMNYIAPGFMVTYVFAQDKEGAIKIANERRIRHILEQEGKV